MTRFSNAKSGKARKRLSRRRPKHRKCIIEPLEDRRLLTTFVSTALTAPVEQMPESAGIAEDVSGFTTLRAAVMEANALAGDDTVPARTEHVQPESRRCG